MGVGHCGGREACVRQRANRHGIVGNRGNVGILESVTFRMADGRGDDRAADCVGGATRGRTATADCDDCLEIPVALLRTHQRVAVDPFAAVVDRAIRIVLAQTPYFPSGTVLHPAIALQRGRSESGIGRPPKPAWPRCSLRDVLSDVSRQHGIDQRLVIELQQRTLQAIGSLAKQQEQFRREVLGQLDRIEDTVLRSERMLQAVLLTRWSECHSFVNSPALNGVYQEPSRRALLELLSDGNAEGYAGQCYAVMTGFLDAYVRSANWAGQIIAGGFSRNHNARSPREDPALAAGA